jgi:hypothetical protein
MVDVENRPATWRATADGADATLLFQQLLVLDKLMP